VYYDACYLIANKHLLQKFIFIFRDMSLWFFMSSWMNEHRHNNIPVLELILSQNNPFTPFHHVSTRYIVISSSHSHLERPRGLSPSDFPLKLYFCPMCATGPAHLIHDHRNNIWRGLQIIKVLVMQPPLLQYSMYSSETRHEEAIQDISLIISIQILLSTNKLWSPHSC
jgi:hypothetical protein